MNKEKIFTFKYDPTISLNQMGEDMLKAVQSGKTSVHLHQISFANIKDITEEFISPRPKLFACLVEKRPISLYQLAKLLNRDYANVYKDVKSLVAMGIVELKKEGERIRPVPLYDQIIFDFQVKKVFPSQPLERISVVN
ncbi:MAG: hypothetical protein MRERV_33c003 [Mycoplasmataceae bacterium RV_VA103A]|nr:MAG: hypothetical protein MRERV_82c007 [Mycoplasmataceae bacterium RV_VA103A]KLL03789.1 MAG: hypothetical protein MRERV_33c003 [Mycoplasmataceae bacterium RV_VA103A]